MSLSAKVIALITGSFIIVFLIAVYHQYTAFNRLVKREKSKFCEDNITEFRQLIEFNKRIASSLSSYIARDPKVIELMGNGDRKGLYKHLRPLYEEVSRNKLIREMVIFKLPATVYLNVRNPRAPFRDASERRKDVLQTGKTCTNTQSILICINYVGIRSTSPIMSGENVLGVASVGVDMSDFLKRYKELRGINAGLAIKDEVLKRSLVERSYKRYLSKRKLVNGFVYELTEPALLDLEKMIPMAHINDVPSGSSTATVCSTPIRDISGSVIGYFFVYADLSPMITKVASETFRQTALYYVPALIIVFGATLMLFHGISSRITRIRHIINRIRERDFDRLPDPASVHGGDELSEIEKDVLILGEEIRKYIDQLSREVELYTLKAYIDSLTGVYNRRALEETAPDLIAKYTGMRKPLSVMMVDFDNFKEVNDTYGHQVGDFVLKESAQLITSTLRETDLVFRYGGEEFFIILPGTSLEGALKAAENVRRKVESHIFRIGQYEISLTVSVGVTEVKDQDIGEIINRADRALYIAKKTGKNRVYAEPHED
jgi:diguanylate cyclase (GGDEF)-like protein